MHDTMRHQWEYLCHELMELPYATIVTAMGCWPQSKNKQRDNNMRAQMHIAQQYGIDVYDISAIISDLDVSDFFDSVGHLKVTNKLIQLWARFTF